MGLNRVGESGHKIIVTLVLWDSRPDSQNEQDTERIGKPFSGGDTGAVCSVPAAPPFTVLVLVAKGIRKTRAVAIAV